MPTLLITFVISGLVLAGVSVPLMLGKIPPNGLYGFRVRKTMEHPEIWYPVNKYAGERLLLAGFIIVLSAIGLTVIPNLTIITYSYANLAIWVVAFSVAIGSTIRHMNSL